MELLNFVSLISHFLGEGTLTHFLHRYETIIFNVLVISIVFFATINGKLNETYRIPDVSEYYQPDLADEAADSADEAEDAVSEAADEADEAADAADEAEDAVDEAGDDLDEDGVDEFDDAAGPVKDSAGDDEGDTSKSAEE